MNSLARIGARFSDMFVVALVMGILLALFAPVPAGLLDFLIFLNITLALLVLLMTFYAPRPVDFSTFPAVLLIATLFRLSLNVSATRLILSQANAGQVIASVGAYAVGGNYVIGLIVFLILVVVQYVVVTNGAQRVSEVAARFTLDSMPGQQMSIDADLNMGFIDQDEAKRRRRVLEREAAFYGAMDGASKFVKGDAIAGIVIMLINIVGGLVIGVLQNGMPWGDALRHYTLLTIGDGIVTQIPALVISVGTGLIVTRSSSDGELGVEVLRQLFAFPRTLAVLMVVVIGLSMLPGMPILPAGLIVLLLLLGYACSRRMQRVGTAMSISKPTSPGVPPRDAEVDPYSVYDAPALEIELGARLAVFVGGTRGELADRVAAFRGQHARESGLVLPRVQFTDNGVIGAQEYRVSLFGERVASSSLDLDRTLAIHPGGERGIITGLETLEPTYGLPALWIDDDMKEAARKAKYTLVDPATVLFTHLCEIVRQRSAELLTRAEADRMLAKLRSSQPGLVEELIPTQLALSDVQKVLQLLLREHVPVRNLQAIVEALIDAVRISKDPTLLAERVRERLSLSICNSLRCDRKTLQVLTLDPQAEDILLRAVTPPAPNAEAAPRKVDPRQIDGVLVRIAAAAERMMKANLLPVILCTPELRRHLRNLCERAVPHLRVISMSEIASGFELRVFATVSVTSQVAGNAAPDVSATSLSNVKPDGTLTVAP